MNIFKLLKDAKFDYDQIKKKMLSGVEIFKYFVSDLLKCRDSNPLQAFPSSSSPPVQTSQKQKSGEQLFIRPSVNVTCLFTAFPPPYTAPTTCHIT